MSSFLDGLTLYTWEDTPLTEFSKITITSPGEPERVVTLGTLIAMTNGAILDILPDDAF